jgi:hypothetical protein
VCASDRCQHGALHRRVKLAPALARGGDDRQRAARRPQRLANLAAMDVDEDLAFVRVEMAAVR